MPYLSPVGTEDPIYADLASYVVSYIKAFGRPHPPSHIGKVPNAIGFGHAGNLLAIDKERRQMIAGLKEKAAAIPDFDRMKALEASWACLKEKDIDKLIVHEDITRYLVQAINLMIKIDEPPLLAGNSRGTTLDFTTQAGAEPLVLSLNFGS